MLKSIVARGDLASQVGCGAPGPYNEGLMGSPVFAFLFALVMCLAGMTTQQSAGSLASPSTEQAVVALQGDGNAPSPASDDPHVQANAESCADLPALIPSRHAAQAPVLTMAPPRSYMLAALHPPYLGGLRRPPRTA